MKQNNHKYGRGKGNSMRIVKIEMRTKNDGLELQDGKVGIKNTYQMYGTP